MTSQYKLDDKNIAEKIALYLSNIDSESKSRGMSIREYIEETLKTSYDDQSSLYILKYYVEKETSEYRDKVIGFLNGLIDIYTRGAVYSLDGMTSIKEMFRYEVNDTEKLVRLTQALREAAGLKDSPFSKTVFHNGRLQKYMKNIIPAADGSILYHVANETEIVRFQEELMLKYSHRFSRERGNQIKERLLYLFTNKACQRDQNVFICIANKDGDYYRLTIDNKRYKLPKDALTLSREIFKIEGFECVVWIM